MLDLKRTIDNILRNSRLMKSYFLKTLAAAYFIIASFIYFPDPKTTVKPLNEEQALCDYPGLF